MIQPPPRPQVSDISHSISSKVGRALHEVQHAGDHADHADGRHDQPEQHTGDAKEPRGGEAKPASAAEGANGGRRQSEGNNSWPVDALHLGHAGEYQ